MAFLRNVLTVLLVLSAVAPSLAKAQEAVPLTITIHKAECPAGYQGDDPFGTCNENRLAGVSFEWGVVAPGAPQTITTDGNGVAVIETSAGAGGLGLSITEQPPYELAGYSVYCSTGDGTEAVPFNYSEEEVGIRFMADTLSIGGEVICDWYNIPVAAPGGGDDGGDQEPVTNLPDTGTGTPISAAGTNFLPVAVVILAFACMGFGLRRRPIW
jgi:hypothetical protein